MSESLVDLPNVGTLRALRDALSGDAGAVVHWWDHERTVLKEVRTQLVENTVGDILDRGELIAFIDELVGSENSPARLFDLGRALHRGAYFLGTRGSSSLKKVLPALLAGCAGLRTKYSAPIYGTPDMPSLNFSKQSWVRHGQDGTVMDPYRLLGERMDDPDLTDLERLEDEGAAIADGGAAMVAYGVLQNGQLDAAAAQRLRTQLLRYCELDTFAMVLAWEGVTELIND